MYAHFKVMLIKLKIFNSSQILCAFLNYKSKTFWEAFFLKRAKKIPNLR